MANYTGQVNRCLKRIKQGDESRYRELFDLTFNHLEGVALLCLRNKSYSEDVVMETYERVMKYISKFDETKDGYGWLCQITKRVAYSFNEKNERFDNAIELEATNFNDEDLFDDADLNVDLNNFIDALDPEDKKIMISHYYLGMTYEEIGAKLGVTKSAIHKRIRKIVKVVRNFLK